MKILKEFIEETITNKALPVSFLTDFISDGWEKVGYLKSDIEVVQNSTGDTGKIESILQNLLDAYLICIGQLEDVLHDNSYLDQPTEQDQETSSIDTAAIPEANTSKTSIADDTTPTISVVVPQSIADNALDLADLKTSLGLAADEEDAVAALERLYLNN